MNTEERDAAQTFDNFVVCKGNQFAYAAAEAVTKNKETDYNPLWLHGASGSGKTHLLRAAAHWLAQETPEIVVRYDDCAALVEQLVASIAQGARDGYEQRFSDVDFLLLDGIDVLEGKEATQQLLCQVIDRMIQAKKRIVLTSIRPPHAFSDLNPYLQSRFVGGLTVELNAPEEAERQKILECWDAEQNWLLTKDMKWLLASRSDSLQQMRSYGRSAAAYVRDCEAPEALDRVARMVGL